MDGGSAGPRTLQEAERRSASRKGRKEKGKEKGKGQPSRSPLSFFLSFLLLSFLLSFHRRDGCMQRGRRKPVANIEGSGALSFHAMRCDAAERKKKKEGSIRFCSHAPLACSRAPLSFLCAPSSRPRAPRGTASSWAGRRAPTAPCAPAWARALSVAATTLLQSKAGRRVCGVCVCRGCERRWRPEV